MKDNTVLVAMSGGVDSSVAAAMLSEQGADCIGVMLKLHGKFTEDDTSCGTDTDERDAQSVASRLGIAFHSYNCEDRFEREVIERFVNSYKNGVTPNPCVECNRYMKFGALFAPNCASIAVSSANIETSAAERLITFAANITGLFCFRYFIKFITDCMVIKKV